MMDPELLQAIIERGLIAQCPFCKENISITSEILINPRRGNMFTINTGWTRTELMGVLREHDLIDKQGKVKGPFCS